MSSRPDAELLLRAAARQHELVHAVAVERERQVLGDPLAPEQRLQVVRVQDGRLRGLLQPVRPERADVGVRAHEDAEVAVEAAQPADRLRPVVVEVEPLARAAVRPLAPHDLRARQERLDPVGDRDRPRARPAAAVRLRERLVQVEVDDVEAHVAGPRDPHHRVQVRAVVVERAADVVHDRRDLADVAVEQAERVRVREHQAGDVLGRLLAQVVQVDAAVGRRARPSPPRSRPSSPSPGSCRARCRA